VSETAEQIQQHHSNRTPAKVPEPMEFFSMNEACAYAGVSRREFKALADPVG
jgi:hypothetical protein